MDRITMQEFELEEEVQDFPYNDQKIALFLKDIRTKELLTPEQEKEQARKIEKRKAEIIQHLRELLQKGRITEEKILTLSNDWAYVKVQGGRARRVREKALILFYYLLFDCDNMLEQQELSKDGRGWFTEIPVDFFLFLDKNIQEKNLSELTEALVSARNEFCERNLLFVVWVVRRYYHYYSDPDLDFLEIVNEGTQGLQIAIDKFNWRLDYRFSASAVWWIKQQIGRALKRSGAIKIPEPQRWLREKITKVRNKRLQETGDYPSLEEIAEDLEVPPSEIQAVFKLPKVVLSLDQPAFFGEDETETYGDLVRAASNTEKEARLSEIKDLIDEALAKLGQRNAAIVKKHLLQDENLREVGDEFNLTRERVRQIIREGKRKLKSSPKLYKIWEEFDE